MSKDILSTRDAPSTVILRAVWYGGQVSKIGLHLLSPTSDFSSYCRSRKTLKNHGLLRSVYVYTRPHDHGLKVYRLTSDAMKYDDRGMVPATTRSVYSAFIAEALLNNSGDVQKDQKTRVSVRSIRMRAKRGIRMGDTACFVSGPPRPYIFVRDGEKFQFTAGRDILVYPDEDKPIPGKKFSGNKCSAYLSWELRYVYPDLMNKAWNSRATGYIIDGCDYYSVYCTGRELGVTLKEKSEMETIAILSRIFNNENAAADEHMQKTGKLPGFRGAFFLVEEYKTILTLASTEMMTKSENAQSPYYSVALLAQLSESEMQEFYVLPLTREGRSLFGMILQPGGKELLLSMAYTSDERHRAGTSALYDAVLDNGTKCFSFLSAEVGRLRSFVQQIQSDDLDSETFGKQNRNRYEVTCYDFQSEALLEYLKKELWKDAHKVSMRDDLIAYGNLEIRIFRFVDICKAFEQGYGSEMQEFYVLPLTREGHSLCGMVQQSGGKELLLSMAYTPEEMQRAGTSVLYDAVLDNGTKCFSFLSAEVGRLRSFVQQIQSDNLDAETFGKQNRNRYEVTCYDFQSEALLKYLKKELWQDAYKVTRKDTFIKYGNLEIRVFQFMEIRRYFEQGYVKEGYQ